MALSIKKFAHGVQNSMGYEAYRLLSVEEAEKMVREYQSCGWELPERITAEAFAKAWNELILVDVRDAETHENVQKRFVDVLGAMDGELREKTEEMLRKRGEHVDPAMFVYEYNKLHKRKYGSYMTM